MPGRQLRLGQDDGGRRYFLDGRPIHAGSGLELLLPSGQWVAGRFEWSYREGKRPVLCLYLGGEWEQHPDPEPLEGGGERYWIPLEAELPIPEKATLRWPPEKEEQR